MAQEQLVAVEYVGLKDREVDHLYGTGLVWTGLGDVKMVPADAWSRMRKHPDVWREAVVPKKGALAQAEEPKPAEIKAQEPVTGTVASEPAPPGEANTAPPPAPPKNKGGRPKGSTKAAAKAKA